MGQANEMIESLFPSKVAGLMPCVTCPSLFHKEAKLYFMRIF